MILYHGSSEIVQNPKFGQGKVYNDYGQGFYCTENVELAKEWACKDRHPGFVTQYELPADKLKILDLTDKQYSILHWLTLLLENREVRSATPVMKTGYKWLVEHYHIDVASFDLITGYRADDSYFTFARAFLGNEISLEQLQLAMNLGKLGIQWTLKSEIAFKMIAFKKYELVPDGTYYTKRKQRDEDARAAYMKLLEESQPEAMYLRDLIKKGGNLL